MSVDWSELQPELIETIATKLKIHKDYIRFRAVCSSWHKSTSKTPKHLPSQLPWLMLPQTKNHNSQPFFTLSDNRIHHLNLPEASIIRRRCGSSHGWLVFLEESPLIFVINPLTRVKHHLPPLNTFPNVTKFSFYDVGREYELRTLHGHVYVCSLREMRDSFIKKVVFSSSPDDEDRDYVALVILNQTGDLAYCKKGDSLWKFIDNAELYCEDVVFHKGCFYSVSKFGNIAVCDICGDVASVSFINMDLQVGGDMQYLVSLGDELLLVSRYLDLGYDGDRGQVDSFYKTVEFRVFKLVLDGLVWESVGKLDEWALFIGGNSSMAFRASEFEGCEGNRVYFTDDYSEWNYNGVNGDHDMGVYDLEDGSVVDFACYPQTFYNGKRCAPPIWITPSLH
ncbi:F-box protein SKIP23-like [Rutidosis leptorrhynchoides]|uniref:F-box protein SKIP23-like n=1 Tax=Rutidosis leptorrhynchoides TaxID=125765 RepID=UPI003A998765